MSELNKTLANIGIVFIHGEKASQIHINPRLQNLHPRTEKTARIENNLQATKPASASPSVFLRTHVWRILVLVNAAESAIRVRNAQGRGENELY
jgi:hypothetical protein